jgi:phosphatidylglycerophosphatase A
MKTMNGIGAKSGFQKIPKMKNFILFFATGGGVGFLPGARGTYGTAVGVLLYWAVKDLPPLNLFLFVLAFFFFSVWAAGLAEVYFQEKDSQKIVVDEIAGYLVTMSFLPFRWDFVVAGFIAFRLFDIMKPFPIRQLERRLKGGWGIVLDDIAAGILANLVLRAAIHLIRS